MARPTKVSLDYFACDVRILDDPKIALVMFEHGPIVASVVLRLLGEIYGREGYWLPWDDDNAMLFAMNTCHGTVTVEQAQTIVASLMKRGFFDAPTYERTGKLTSHGIQSRWEMAMKAAHRQAEIDPEINLLSEEFRVSSETFANNSESFAKDSELFAANKIKEKKSKAITPPKSPPAGEDGVAFDECSSPEEMFTYSEQVCAAWNETFHGTEREVVAVNQPLKQNYRAALIDAHAEGITPDQFRRAFSVLRDTPRLSWQLHSAIKPDNVRMLLTEGENARHVRAAARSGPVIPVHSQTEYATEGEFWGGR
ncbi:MAG: DUF4373 domain-containing protein [Thermoguttaceae bacterium]|nr:DUF4373 domain-containing protein [Thermoguttaceae bacterium]